MKPRQLLETLVVPVAIVSFIVPQSHIHATITNHQSDGSVTIIPSHEPTLPLNPNSPNPEEPVIPVGPDGKPPESGTSGPLSIDFASSLSFGYREIVNRDSVYSARSQVLFKQDGKVSSYVPNYVQVTDNRGSNAGWTLEVTQKGQLEASVKTVNESLVGAKITLNSPNVIGITDTRAPVAKNTELDPNGNSSVIMAADKNSGAGTWITRWGSQNDLLFEKQKVPNQIEMETVQVNPDVTLSIPGTTPRDAVLYTTTLNWTLSNVPMIIQ